MLNIAICDDEKMICNQINGYIDDFFKGRNLSYHTETFYDSITFLEAYQNGRFDLVFLDIAMSPMTGLEIAAAIRENDNKTAIVFVTGHLKHMQEGLSLHILEYIPKPINPERFESLMTHFCEDIKNLESKFLVLKSGGTTYKIPLADILYLTKAKNKIVAVTEKEQFESYDLNLDTVKKELDASFCQTHKSFIVNMRHIVKKESKECIMCNGDVVDCSKKHYKTFSDVYSKYLIKLG